MNFGEKNDILYKIVNGREVLAVPKMMQVEIVKNSHCFGHFSAVKTEEIVKCDFYFLKMKKCIKNVVNNYIKCSLVNKKRGKGEVYLNPISKEVNVLMEKCINRILNRILKWINRKFVDSCTLCNLNYEMKEC